MEKKIWMQPVAVVEKFMANEYVAACGDQHKVYKFKCDARAGTLYADYDGDGDMDRLGSYNPCSVTHEAGTSEAFVDGFVDYNDNRRQDDGEAVIVWVQYDWLGRFRNAHATTNLDMDSWETAKS